MGKNHEDESDAAEGADPETLGASFANLSLNGVPIGSEPLWEARVREIAAWLPDETRREMASVFDRMAPGGQAPDISGFAAEHGLTPAETRLVESIAGGASVAEHAERQGISTNTARVHMQRVLEKTGARRQAELVRMILA